MGVAFGDPMVVRAFASWRPGVTIGLVLAFWLMGLALDGFGEFLVLIFDGTIQVLEQLEARLVELSARGDAWSDVDHHGMLYTLGFLMTWPIRALGFVALVAILVEVLRGRPLARLDVLRVLRAWVRVLAYDFLLFSILAATLALLTACYDVPTGATAASDPNGIGIALDVEDAEVAVEAGPNGMGMSMGTPEGDQVSMGVKVTEGGKSTAMGVKMRAADGVGVVMELRGSEDGARIVLDLTE